MQARPNDPCCRALVSSSISTSLPALLAMDGILDQTHAFGARIFDGQNPLSRHCSDSTTAPTILLRPELEDTITLAHGITSTSPPVRHGSPRLQAVKFESIRLLINRPTKENPFSKYHHFLSEDGLDWRLAIFSSETLPANFFLLPSIIVS